MTGVPLRFKLRQLEYFIAVADAGSIVAASRSINVAAPSISTALSQLEEEFGVAFFVRHHAHGLSLTPGGRRFLVAARDVVDGAASLHDIANDIADQIRGPISVGSLITVAPFILPAIRQAFQTANPDVEFQQQEENQMGLIRMLRRADIDLAITYDLEVPGDIDFEPLLTLPPYAVFSPDHPLAGHASVSLKSLAGQPMVLLDLPLSREYFLSLFQAAGLRPTIQDRTMHLSMVQSLAANGVGYGLLNIPSLNTHAPDGKPLRFVKIRDKVRPLNLGLATMQSKRKTRTVMAFEQHCRSMITAQT